MKTITELDLTRESAKDFVKNYLCSECGSFLSLAWGGKWGINDYVVRCKNLQHTGFAKEKSLTQKWEDGDSLPIYMINNIERSQRKKMERQLGEKSKALAPYYSALALTQEKATFILQTIWPGASAVAVLKAAMICEQYKLNPLMKHIFLLKFTNHKTGEVTWEPVQGIKATRLIASRREHYSYKDGPRRMTEKEQDTIFGEVDNDRIWAITVLENGAGNKAPGYGFWLLHDEPYGKEKGNSKANMAFIRSERNAFDRLFPGEMPDIPVMDEAYIDGQVTVLEETPLEKPPTEPRVGDTPPELEIENLEQLDKLSQELSLSPLQVCNCLGVKNLSDVKDFRGVKAKLLKLRADLEKYAGQEE